MMNKRLLRGCSLLLLSMVVLNGCERPAPRIANGLPLPAQTFEHIERLPVNVGNVQILMEDALRDARVGGFSISLTDRAMLYLSKKFETSGAFGADGQLVARVEVADVQHMQRPSDHRLLQTINLDRINRYFMELAIRLEHVGRDGRVLHGQVLRVSKVLNLSEHSSIAAREQAQFDAVEEMFDLLDPQVTQVVKDNMKL